MCIKSTSALHYLFVRKTNSDSLTDPLHVSQELITLGYVAPHPNADVKKYINMCQLQHLAAVWLTFRTLIFKNFMTANVGNKTLF